VSSDPGLQPERTRLAWRRTALAFTVVTLLHLRLALGRGAPGALLAVVVLLGWGTALVACRRRADGTTTRAGDRALPVVALVGLGYALAGALLVLCPLG
jgi:uncharacterized membrane protein YidH (DUF202 family)